MGYIFKLLILLIPVILFIFYFSYTKSKSVSIFIAFFLLIILTIFIFHVGKETYVNYHQPPEWDFLTFWLDGNVASTGENFYNVKSYQEMPLPYEPSDGFREEVIDVGFRYPPFTMFLFLPLALFDIDDAYLLWQISILMISVACIYELWGLFPKEKRILSLLLVSVLMFRLTPVHVTFHGSQTNFIVLLFFLMFWRNRTKGWGGIWLALCVVVKPYMALLYIYPLFTRKWKMLAIAISALLILTFLSILAFGTDVFVSFFVENPTSKLPIFAYTEGINQSLLSTILRLNPHQAITESPLLNPLYLGISLSLTLITVWVAVMKKNSDDWVALSVLFLALIVYPASLEHYSVFLIVPVVLLLRQSSQNVKERMIIFFIIFVTYFLSGYDFGSYMFFANVFMWLVCIVLAAKLNLSTFMHTIASSKPVAQETALL
jgi:hypothetical protein